MIRWQLGLMLLAGTCWCLGAVARADNPNNVLPSVAERFASEDVSEVPSFQRHVVPLFGRLGCNGRACHGSFQGRGGFRLSLFGYDFQADYEALLDPSSTRVDREHPLESLILVKPTNADEHEGGLRYEKGSWQYHVFRRWIEAGAKFDPAKDVQKLVALEVTPSEIIFHKKGDKFSLRAVAVWEDGTREDVTPLCRFQSNDSQIAEIDENGQVTGGDPGDTHLVVFYDKAVVPVPIMRAVSESLARNYPNVPTPTKIDELVVAKLRKLGVVPSELCSDAEFLRRVSLDLTGTLPLAEEVEQFLADPSPDKRARKIDELLESPGYAAWWTTKLCDFTGNNETELVNVLPVRGAASQAWYDWIFQRVKDNVPYDELVAGIVTATSRAGNESYYEFCKELSDILRPGSNRSFAERPSMPFYWARRNFRQPPERAISFAYAFLGVRIECAQCHKHPFDQWSKHDFEEFAKFFGGVRLANQGAPGSRSDYAKIVEALGIKDGRVNNQNRNQILDALRDGKVIPFAEVYVTNRPVNANRRQRDAAPPARTATLLGGEVVDLNAIEDPRQALMNWLRSPDNPYFARAFVNRVWAHYFGVGIVEPPDDHSLANPPSNAALLDYLTQGFIRSGFDMKWVHREILNSRTYQLSWQPNETNQHDKRNFARAYLRRLPAEVAIDAIRMATASDSEAARMKRELDGRAIAMASPDPRQRNGASSYALTVFGRSTRESNCDCDRSMTPSLLQTIYLQNDSEVLALLDRRQSGWIDQITRQFQPNARTANGGRRRADEGADSSTTASGSQPSDVQVEELVRKAYLRTVSRLPTNDELKRAKEHLDACGSPIEGLADLLWALINTKEFIVNH
ncbi:MAG: hypothetical protein KatS3mg110_1872 [Pirellulaceae bacterium]|nr:MAG: hypothetical protein KatS3mg110_1872 [Pirellulaceae bacterium]